MPLASFVVQPEVFARFPGLRVVGAVARGVENRGARETLAARWAAEWREASRHATHGNAQSHPRVKPWRERFTAMGVSGKQFPSSVEALLRRALKGGEPPRINALVDLYNAISLHHLVPAGGFDLGGLRGPLELRLTRGGDTFHALDAEAPEPVAPGEVAYADGSRILTRHFVWRQSREGLIEPATRDVVLVSEILGEVDGGVADAVLADLAEGLREHFGAEPRTFVVEEAAPVADWPA